MKKYLYIGIIGALLIGGIFILQPQSQPIQPESQEQTFGGTSALVDSFDTYNDGDLNGQGSWTADVAYDVQAVTVQAGAKAVSVTGVSSNIDATKLFTGATTGNQVWWMRASANNAYNGYAAIQEASVALDVAALRLDSNGYITYYTSAPVNLIAYSANTWYRCEIEWDTVADQARYRAGTSDGSPGTWTSWVNFVVGRTATTVDNVRVRVPTENTGTTFYFDSFSDPNAVPPVVPKKVLPPIIIEEI